MGERSRVSEALAWILAHSGEVGWSQADAESFLAAFDAPMHVYDIVISATAELATAQ